MRERTRTVGNDLRRQVFIFKGTDTDTYAKVLKKDVVYNLCRFHESYILNPPSLISYRFTGTSTANLALTFSVRRQLITSVTEPLIPVVDSLTTSAIDISAAVTSWTAITLATTPTNYSRLDIEPVGKVLAAAIANIANPDLQLCMAVSGADVPADAVLEISMTYSGHFYNA